MELTIAASVSVFLAVLLVVLGFYQAQGNRSLARRRLETLEAYSVPRPETPPSVALRDHGSAWAERTRAQLEQAGLALKLHEYLTLRFALALLTFAIVLLVGKGHWVAFATGASLGVVAYMVPAFYLRTRIKRQVQRFNDQLEEMLAMVSGSLRSGFGLLQALDLAAEQTQPPMSTELRRLLRDTRMGASLEDALEGLRERIGGYDLEVVVTAILIQRAVGSNLSEVLDKVVHTIRERRRIRGEISTLTTQKRLSGWIVGLLPVGFVLLMMAINFDYMSVLFTDPVGRLLLVVAVALDVIGLLAIRRIVSIDI